MQTENLKSLRELRAQEKAIKARIETVKPLAIEEAIALAPEGGGKFPVEGVGEFILDVNPVLEKDPKDENYTGPDILTSTAESAVNYRKYLKEKAGYQAKASGLTKTIRGFYDAFRQKFGHRATKFNYTLKCVGLD